MELTTKQKAAFGIGAVGKDMVYALSASYVMYYYQDVLGLPATFVGLILGGSLFLFGRTFLALFTTESAVIDAGMKRVGVMGFAYCISAFMDCTIAASRGLGKTVVPTVIVVLGSCVFRVIWVYTIFAHFHTIPSLYALYPCSWALTALAEIVYFAHCYKESMRIFEQPKAAA